MLNKLLTSTTHCLTFFVLRCNNVIVLVVLILVNIRNFSLCEVIAVYVGIAVAVIVGELLLLLLCCCC